jgi:hypothetical protein
MLVIGQVSRTGAFTFLPSAYVPSHKVVVFALRSDAALAVLQARVHDVWARFFSSSFKDDLSYTPTDCFENFPFPDGWTTSRTLEMVGETYRAFRASLMVERSEGLTKTFNRFHDPDESDQGILKLRAFQADIDHAVLSAYGWKDIPVACDFFLDYEIDEDEWGSKRRPYRYRWPDSVRDEVLARLLELNTARAKEEARSGAVADPAPQRRPRRKRAAKRTRSGELFS